MQNISGVPDHIPCNQSYQSETTITILVYYPHHYVITIIHSYLFQQSSCLWILKDLSFMYHYLFPFRLSFRSYYLLPFCLHKGLLTYHTLTCWYIIVSRYIVLLQSCTCYVLGICSNGNSFIRVFVVNPTGPAI